MFSEILWYFDNCGKEISVFESVNEGLNTEYTLTEGKILSDRFILYKPKIYHDSKFLPTVKVDSSDI